jgi:tRNA pseudouridine38-40 synthase
MATERIDPSGPGTQEVTPAEHRGSPTDMASPTRLLIRFGYDGRPFAGWARQPSLRTVEGEILAGLWRSGVVPAGSTGDLEVASRTDRGVSARANALAVRTGLPARVLLRCLNGISPEIFFTAARTIPGSFRVRGASVRTYRYYDPNPVGGWRSWDRTARHLVGDLDVRSFGRGIPASAPCWRTVDAVSVIPRDRGVVVEIRARSFVWGMVRKMVAALRARGDGRLGLRDLDAAVRGNRRLTLPLAEPEGLVLWEVRYPDEWDLRWDGPNRHQVAWTRSVRDDLWRRAHVLQAATDEDAPTRRRSPVSVSAPGRRGPVSRRAPSAPTSAPS